MDEFIKFILLLHSNHDSFEVLSNVLSQPLRQADILHSCVCRINDILLLLGLATDLRNQNSKFTENIGLEDCSSQIDYHHEDELLELFRTHFITTDDQHRVIEANEVEEHLLVTLFVTLPIIISTIVVIVRRNPRLPSVICLRVDVRLLDEEEPHAGYQVQVNDEECIEVQHLHQTFIALVHV